VAHKSAHQQPYTSDIAHAGRNANLANGHFHAHVRRLIKRQKRSAFAKSNMTVKLTTLAAFKGLAMKGIMGMSPRPNIVLVHGAWATALNFPDL
jgi:hypothetical protein